MLNKIHEKLSKKLNKDKKTIQLSVHIHWIIHLKNIRKLKIF